MILILTATAAVFMTGVVLGILAMVVIGIHAEERHTARMGEEAATRVGAAARRLLSERVAPADAPEHEDARR
jgi:hypothetical protein